MMRYPPVFLRRRFASASLFVRLLMLLFASVLATQAVTFALVLAMPTPSPLTTALPVVIGALRTGRVADTRLRVAYGEAPADNWSDPSERQLARQIAVGLGVSQARVRIVSLRAFDGAPPRRPGEDEARGSFRVIPDDRDGGGPGRPGEDGPSGETGALAGRFEAAVQLADGRWRVVSSVGSRIATWQWEVLLWLLASMAVVAPFAWFFAKRIADPIAAFGAAARAFGRDPSVRLAPISGPPEIDDALIAVNDMQRQISRYVEDRTMMVGAIAHDLRTPLMRLSLRLQKAPDDIRTASEGDIREIEEMATAALSFVRDLSVRDGRHRVALRALIETVADEFADAGAAVDFEAGADATVYAELNGLKRMLTNIVGNAVAYADDAHIRLTVAPGRATIAVADTGPGIPDAERARVFDPFYRVEQSRNRNTGGIGLGLASARAVARAHGGDIVLTNRAGGGLLATIDLPL